MRQKDLFLEFYCGFFQEPLPVEDNRKYNRTVLPRNCNIKYLHSIFKNTIVRLNHPLESITHGYTDKMIDAMTHMLGSSLKICKPE